MSDELTNLLAELSQVERDIKAYTKTVVAAQNHLRTLQIKRLELLRAARPVAIETAMIADLR